MQHFLQHLKKTTIFKTARIETWKENIPEPKMICGAAIKEPWILFMILTFLVVSSI